MSVVVVHQKPSKVHAPNSVCDETTFLCYLLALASLASVQIPVIFLPHFEGCQRSRYSKLNTITKMRLTASVSTNIPVTSNERHGLKPHTTRLFVQQFVLSSMLLSFVRGIHRWPVDSLHKGPVTEKAIPWDDITTKPAFVGDVLGDIFIKSQVWNIHVSNSQILIMTLSCDVFCWL